MSNQLSQVIPSSIPNSPAFSIAKKYVQSKPPSTPGPGTYNPKTLFRSSPKAVFSGSKDSFFKTQQSPGPGQYRDCKFNSTGFKFARQKRCMTQESQVPGPGAYKTQYIFFIPNCVIPKATYNKKLKNQQVGPGSYDIPAMMRADIGFKIPNSQRKINIRQSPGPADYSQDSNRKKKGVVFPKSPRLDQNKSFGPGPAEYSPRYTKENSPRAVIGTASRDGNRKDPSPGPGDYNSKDVRSISFSFPKKQDRLKMDCSPFSYIQEYTSLRKTAVAFPRSSRNQKIQISPGPGDYNIESFFRRKISDN